jgi:phosphoglycerate dehydrogenase-like enzyme
MASKNLFILVAMPPQARNLFSEELLQRLSQAHPHVQTAMVEHQEHFEKLLPEADAVVIWPRWFRFPPHALAQKTRLRWIQSITAGVDALLTPELMVAEHITITSTKGPMGPLMAEHIVLLMLALARDLPGFLQDQAARRWRFLSDERPMAQMYEKTIAILGVGAIGGDLARICKLGFRMRVLGMARTRRDNPHVDRYVDRMELHDALAEADVVALCLALTPATTKIVDAAALAAMKPTAYVINVARGALIDEEALIEALRTGRIAGAGLDATVVQPLPADSPLWTLPNVIITPHVAPARERVNEYLVDFWCQNIHRFAANEPLDGLVDRHAGY